MIKDTSYGVKLYSLSFKVQACGWVVEGGLAEISSECQRHLRVRARERGNTLQACHGWGKISGI